MEATTIYFDKAGRENTDQTLRLAKARADTLGIGNIVVASYTGFTGLKAAEVFSGRNLVVVVGVVRPDRAALPGDKRSAIEAAGGKVLHTGHAFGMLGRAVHRKLGAIQADELIARVLKLFCEGVKVGCEVACMAADAGLIPAGGEAVAIGGTARGADTALVLRAANTQDFFDTRILEIICRPR